jgi:hypothetical protein
VTTHLEDIKAAIPERTNSSPTAGNAVMNHVVKAPLRARK